MKIITLFNAYAKSLRQSETFAAAIRARLADIETENAQLREDLRLVSLERDRYLSGVRMAASSVRRQEPAADHSINEVLNITAGQGDWNINPPTEVAA